MFPTKLLNLVLCLQLVFLTAFAQTEKNTQNLSEEKSNRVSQKSKNQPQQKKSFDFKSWSVGVSNIQWNEDLQLQQGLQTSDDVANFNGLAISAHKDHSYDKWGWNIGFLLGMGKASGGGNSSSVTYAQRVNFNLLGVSPRVYYKLSGRISSGISAVAFIKNIDWPSANNVTARSRGTTNITSLLDLNIRLTPKIDFYSGLGPLSDGSTLWKIGLSYRL